MQIARAEFVPSANLEKDATTAMRLSTALGEAPLLKLSATTIASLRQRRI
jgi:hypothetical protein